MPVFLDPLTHRLVVRGAVLLAEGVPGETGGRDREVRKHAAPDDILRMVELEEEDLAGREAPELPAAARLPEVDFVEVRPGLEKSIPVAVGDSYPRLHALVTSPDSIRPRHCERVGWPWPGHR